MLEVAACTPLRAFGCAAADVPHRSECCAKLLATCLLSTRPLLRQRRALARYHILSPPESGPALLLRLCFLRGSAAGGPSPGGRCLFCWCVCCPPFRPTPPGGFPPPPGSRPRIHAPQLCWQRQLCWPAACGRAGLGGLLAAPGRRSLRPGGVQFRRSGGSLRWLIVLRRERRKMPPNRSVRPTDADSKK